MRDTVTLSLPEAGQSAVHVLWHLKRAQRCVTGAGQAEVL